MMNRRDAIKTAAMTAICVAIPMAAATIPAPWILERTFRWKTPPDPAELWIETYRWRNDGRGYWCASYGSTSPEPFGQFRERWFAKLVSDTSPRLVVSTEEFLTIVEQLRILRDAEYV